jgi:hypothetical protein
MDAEATKALPQCVCVGIMEMHASRMFLCMR